MESGPEGCCFPSKYLWGAPDHTGLLTLEKKKLFFFLSSYLERQHAIYGGLLNSESPWDVWLKDHFRELTWWSGFGTLPFNVGGVGSIPGQGAGIPHGSGP